MIMMMVAFLVRVRMIMMMIDGGLLGGGEDDLALRLEVVKQLKLSGSNIAKVDRLEEEKVVNHYVPSFQF